MEWPGPPAQVTPPAATAATDELERELEALRPLLASAEPSPVAPPESFVQSQPDVEAAPLEGDLVQSPEARPLVSVPETYSGRLYLMFPSSLSQDEVGSIWEILDELAGSGSIVDNRLVSMEAGIQFTLSLGSKTFSVEQLLKQMPGAELAALEEDRLRVDWPRRT